MSKTLIEILFDAIKNDDRSAARNIVTDLKVDINCVEPSSGTTPLLRSIFQQNSELVKLCLELGADVNLPAKIEGENITPIMRAVFQRNAEIVSILAQDTKIQTSQKYTIQGTDFTPYDRALYQQDFNIAMILGNLYDVNKVDHEGLI